MMRWFALAASGCLVVDASPAETGVTQSGIPLGNVHACTLELPRETAYWTICFAHDDDVVLFEHEMMDGCQDQGYSCTVSCSTSILHPCVHACPGKGIPRGCNASHGCFCPR